MNNIETLRDHLFKTLAALSDKTNPMDLDRAKTISEVAQTIINTAKVEVDYAKATNATSNIMFLEPSAQNNTDTLPRGITGITRHQIR